MHKLGRTILYTATTQRGWCIEAFVSIILQSQSQKSLPGGGGVYHMFPHTYIHTYTHIPTYSLAYLHVSAHCIQEAQTDLAHTDASVRVYVYIYIYRYIYMYMYMYMYI